MKLYVKTYDLIIIGGGSAGLAAAEYSATLNKQVALIEKAKLGGGSLWSGCVPSKTLLHEAHKIFRHGKLEAKEAYFRAKEKIEEAERKIVKIHDNKRRFESLGVEVYSGKAAFVDPKTIRVGADVLKGEHFLIATGSRPVIPDIEGLRGVKYLTTDNIFELDTVPTSLIVVGGGPNGVELAQAFNRLGVKVTLLQRSGRLLPRDDEEIAQFIQMKLVEEGVDVQCNASIKEVKTSGKEIEVMYAKGQISQSIAAAGLLLVTGRKSVIDGLDLQKAGVKEDEKGVWCNGRLQTSTSHIYLAGDVGGAYGFTHYAAAQGTHAVQNMFKKQEDFNPREVPWVTFTDPEAAHVGMTETELIKNSKKYQKLYLLYEEIERAITDGKTQGFIKILVGDKGQIIGAQIVGERAGELIHEVVTLMEYDIPVAHATSIIHAYPTYSSGLGQVFFNGVHQKSTDTAPMKNVLDKLERLGAKKK